MATSELNRDTANALPRQMIRRRRVLLMLVVKRACLLLYLTILTLEINPSKRTSGGFLNGVLADWGCLRLGGGYEDRLSSEFC